MTQFWSRLLPLVLMANLSCVHDGMTSVPTPAPASVTAMRTNDNVPLAWKVRVRVAIEPKADATWGSEIVAALMFWNAIVGRELLTVVDITGSPDLIVVIDALPDNHAGVTMAWYHPITGEIGQAAIAIDERVRKDSAYRVIIHEFGHALGLAHDEDDPQSVMYPTAADGAWFLRENDATYIFDAYN